MKKVLVKQDTIINDDNIEAALKDVRRVKELLGTTCEDFINGKIDSFEFNNAIIKFRVFCEIAREAKKDGEARKRS